MMHCAAHFKNCEFTNVLHEGRKTPVLLYIPRARLLSGTETQVTAVTRNNPTSRKWPEESKNHRRSITGPHCRYCTPEDSWITSVLRCRPQLFCRPRAISTWQSEGLAEADACTLHNPAVTRTWHQHDHPNLGLMLFLLPCWTRWHRMPHLHAAASDSMPSIVPSWAPMRVPRGY